MYLGYQQGKIKFYTEQPLDKAFYNLEKIEETELEYVLDGEEYILKDEAWEEKQAEEEHNRIQSLYMTRSDFFDGTIKAFGADKEDLLPIIKEVLNTIGVDEIEKKIALNNFENALNFYRKHPLFTMLSNVELPIGEEIIITEEQWDKFFDEVNKGNTNAYIELLPKEEA